MTRKIERHQLEYFSLNINMKIPINF